MNIGVTHRPWSLLFQRGHLLPQRQVLDQKFFTCAKDSSEGMDAECHQKDEKFGTWRRSLPTLPRKFKPFAGHLRQVNVRINNLILLMDE